MRTFLWSNIFLYLQTHEHGKMDESIRLLTSSVRDLYSKVSTIENDSSDNVTTLVNYIKKMMARIKNLEGQTGQLAEFDTLKSKVYELEPLKSRVAEMSNLALKVSNLEREVLDLKTQLDNIRTMLDTIFVQSHNTRLIQLEESVRYLLETTQHREPAEFTDE